MISFVPESLQADIIESLNEMHFLKGDIEEIEFSVFQKLEESADEYDCEISENSMVCLSVGEDDFPLISVREFLDMAKCKAHLKINDAQSYAKSCNEVYFLLDVRDYATLELLSNTFLKKDVPITELEKTVILDGVKYKVGLFHGFCIYHLLVEESGNFDKYCPSYSSYDYFIRVHCDGENIKQKVADSLASAYAFELQSSFDIILPFSNGRIDDEFVDYSTESLLGRETQMFPLIYGNGATELLELYNTAKNTFDVDFKILGLTKVIEYIAPTIAQKELIERVKTIFGKPDIAFVARKIAIFCDGDFWHGYDWANAQNEIKSNRDFWIPKIERNMHRDLEVTTRLQEQGWTVLRFWGHEILKEMDYCISTILDELRSLPQPPYRTIDLCAGIGGIRRGFELTGRFRNVLSSEIDKYACKTYQHLYGDNPCQDLTTDEFKQRVSETPYDVLLAGFPCQTFSRVGLQEGFENEEKGQIFFHISEIIKNTRPFAIFLENVDRLVTHDDGKTFKTIIDTLVNKLGYYVIGVEKQGDGSLKYTPKAFIRNSRDFGVPQNRPRTYIIGFDTERFSPEKLVRLPHELPSNRVDEIYHDLNDVLEHSVPAKYYMASGYLDTLIRHRARQEGKGYGFGYRIVNAAGIERPIANTLLATGGSGRERNLIYDPQDGIAGLEIRGKKTPLNDKGIRVMTPSEWGKLQGFINYGFINENGKDEFSFPEGIPNVQRYKQFGNSVTIPVIEQMANFILNCLEALREEQ